MKVALCCIGRLENRYAIEYIEYYKNLGVDKIFVYDNNHDEEEHFEDVLQSYINEEFVEVINFRNKETCQLEAYQDCYNKHSNEYDWICFFDFDEYLTFTNPISIQEFLSNEKFLNYNMIHINWMIYDDNNLIKYENKPLLERFTHPVEPYDFKRAYDWPENNHIKSIIRGGLNNVQWNATSHTPVGNISCCNAIGEICDGNSPFTDYIFKDAYIKHFVTKTIEEFYDTKVKRSFNDATINLNYFDSHDWSKYFFKVNKKTKEKIDFVNSKKLNIYICTHKDFTPPVTNEIYKICDYRNINIKYFGVDDLFFSEIASYFYISEHYELKEYIGFCHYRKYFEFFDDIPDITDIFDKYDVVLGKEIEFTNLSFKDQYAITHNIEDLEIVENIIKNDYNEYWGACQTVLNRNYLYPCNMFIMKSNDFKEYICWVWDILKKYIDIVGTDINKRIEENKEKYILNKGNSYGKLKSYQYRIGGYLAERLTNIYVEKHFNRIKTYNIVHTETKPSYNITKKELLLFLSSNYPKHRINNDLIENKYELFDEVNLLTPNDLDNYIKPIIEYNIKTYHTDEHPLRGYGYWVWKPYIILQELNKLNDEDILVYLDIHCNLNFIKDKFDDITKELNKQSIIIGYVNDDRYNTINIAYTTTKLKKYIENYLNYTFTDEQMNSYQCEGGIIFMKNTEFTRKFVQTWLDIMLNGMEYVSDLHNRDDDNDKSFIENRHDQSVISLLYKYYNLKHIDYINWNTLHLY